MRKDCETIYKAAIEAVLPERAVESALKKAHFASRKRYIVAIGKAAWRMASAAMKAMEGKVDGGIVITKDGHSMGALEGLQIFEAAHPIPDERGIRATMEVLRLTSDLSKEDTVIFLVSGGGSALFEAPCISPGELAKINEMLLKSGADIAQINLIRKRLSLVKGGKFARHCAPAKVFAILLSDVLGDRPEMIASGPSYPDLEGSDVPLSIVQQYGLSLSGEALCALHRPGITELPNVENHVQGSVKQLCFAAAQQAEKLGYRPVLLTDSLCCEAREAGRFLGSIAQTHQHSKESLAFLCGGETVVTVKGRGKGGRNQELALSAAEALRFCRQTALFSIGSDGTDGPTDAAGGYADENTYRKLLQKGLSAEYILAENDAYHGLMACGGLLKTGPTGTNVNDLTVLLIRR